MTNSDNEEARDRELFDNTDWMCRQAWQRTRVFWLTAFILWALGLLVWSCRQ